MVGYAEKSANGCPPGSLAADTVGSLGADGRLKLTSRCKKMLRGGRKAA